MPRGQYLSSSHSMFELLNIHNTLFFSKVLYHKYLYPFTLGVVEFNGLYNFEVICYLSAVQLQTSVRGNCLQAGYFKGKIWAGYFKGKICGGNWHLVLCKCYQRMWCNCFGILYVLHNGNTKIPEYRGNTKIPE